MTSERESELVDFMEKTMTFDRSHFDYSEWDGYILDDELSDEELTAMEKKYRVVVRLIPRD